MAEKADVRGDNDVFDTLTLLTMLTLSRLAIVGARAQMCSFDIVNNVNNVICQTAIDRILVCHDNSCMRRAETGYTPRGFC
jgi:hypothetical protein